MEHTHVRGIQSRPSSILRNQKGFSLIELVVVLSIISVLLMMTTSIAPVISRFRFQNESVKMKNALVLARNWAMTKGACVAVSVNSVAHTLSVESFALSANLDCTGPQTNKQVVSIVEFAKYVGLNNFDDGNPLVFGYRGSTTRGEVASVSLFSDDMANTVNFLVTPITGEVRSK
jgi:prepilin-type N-terminal cleavage/methylation domain-containing protein